MWSVVILGPKIFGLWWSVVVCGVQADPNSVATAGFFPLDLGFLVSSEFLGIFAGFFFI